MARTSARGRHHLRWWSEIVRKKRGYVQPFACLGVADIHARQPLRHMACETTGRKLIPRRRGSQVRILPVRPPSLRRYSTPTPPPTAHDRRGYASRKAAKSVVGVGTATLGGECSIRSGRIRMLRAHCRHCRVRRCCLIADRPLHGRFWHESGFSIVRTWWKPAWPLSSN
jgi:hypothetical protein